MKPMATGVVLALALAAPAGTLWAQGEAEVKARVPELEAFHKVIYPMWHTAWPARDTTMLRELWPEIQAHVATVEKAELPGILRDKKAAWEKGIQRLKTAENAYGEALGGGTMDDKLAAAEEMHSAFEGLVRTIRPMMRELAHFHEVLYKIYHYYVPNEDAEAFEVILPALGAETDTLKRAAVPKRFTESPGEFKRARAALAGKVKTVIAVVPKRDWDKTKRAVEEMHTAYQALERLFQ